MKSAYFSPLAGSHIYPSILFHDTKDTVERMVSWVLYLSIYHIPRYDTVEKMVSLFLLFIKLFVVFYATNDTVERIVS